MDQRPLSERVREIESRLGAIERKLGLDAVAPPTDTATDASAPPSAGPPPTPPTAPPVWPERKLPALSRVTTPDHAGPAGRPSTSARPARGGGAAGLSWEQFLGAKLAAWIGGVVVVAAAGYFLKYAYDRGWLAAVTPATRCVVSAIFGSLLLGGGEWAYRRVGRFSAAGLYAAGLGVLYVTVLAALHVFELLSPAGAFLLLALVAFVGIAVTVRSRGLAVGVLSLALGYVSLFAIGTPAALGFEAPLFMTVLLGVALALSGLWRRPFRSLRGVLLPLHGIAATLWAVFDPGATPQMVVVFATLWWAMVSGEALWAALRGQTAAGNVVTSLVGTAWFVNLALWEMRVASTAMVRWTGGYTLGLALVSAAIAFTFGSGINPLRTRPRRAIDRLALAMWIESGVLLVAAIALQFDGMERTLSWLVLGAAAVEIGRRLEAKGIERFGLVQLALGLAALLTIDAIRLRTGMPAFSTLPFGAGSGPRMWDVLLAVAAIAFLAAGLRLRDLATPMRSFVRSLVFGLGVVLLLGAAQALFEGRSATVAWAAFAVTLVWARRLDRMLPIAEAAAAVGLAAAARWLGVDVLLGLAADPSGRPADPRPLLLDAATGVAVAGSIVASAWGLERDAERREGEVPLEVPPEVSAVRGALGGLALALLPAVLVVASPVVARSSQDGRLLWPLWTIASVAAFAIVLPWRPADRQVLRLARTSAHQARLVAPLFAGVTLLAVLVGLIATIVSGQSFASAAVVNDTLFWGGWNIVVLAVAIAMLVAVANSAAPDVGARSMAGLLLFAASAMLLLAAFVASESFLPIRPTSFGLAAWPAAQLRHVWWVVLTIAWGVALVVAGVVAGRFRLPPMARTIGCVGAAWVASATVGWLAIGTLPWRIALKAPVAAPPFLNPVALSGVVVVVACVAARRMLRRSSIGSESGPGDQPLVSATSQLTNLLAVLAAVAALWLGTLELERFFATAAGDGSAASAFDRVVARPVTSVWWALFGIGTVVAGFRHRVAGVRYAGLALLGITVAKFLVIDMQGVQTLWRVVAMAIVGLLLVATSIVYWKAMALQERRLAGSGTEPSAPS